MNLTDAEIAALVREISGAGAKAFMRETDGVVGSRDLIRLTAKAATLERAAGGLPCAPASL